jgi:hypothetical protein
MAIAVFSFKIDPDSKVRVLHVFFAETKAAADAELKQHAAACPKFGPAWHKNETVEFARTIEEIPPTDEDELEEWLDTFLCEFEDAEDDTIEVEPE